MKLLSMICATLLAVFGLTAQSAYADAGVPPVLNISWTPNPAAIRGSAPVIRFDIGNPGTVAALTGVASILRYPQA